MVVENGHAVGKSNRQKKRMLDFVSNIWSRQIVVEPLRVILYFNFLFCSTFVLSFNKLLIQLVCWKRLNKRVKFLLLIVSGWTPRINKYFRAYNSSKYLGLFCLVLLNINDNEQMKVLAFVVVGGGWELHGAKVDLSIYHLHFTVTPYAHI